MRRVVFELTLFQGPAQRLDSEAVMAILLDALVAANVVYLKHHPQTPSIYSGSVVYKRERPVPGAANACTTAQPRLREGILAFGLDCQDLNAIPEVWKTIPFIFRDGWGDCEDLACARVAEYLRQGVPARPTFKWRVVGTMLVYHIMVELPGGRIEDPSRRLGMGGPWDVA